MGFAVCKSTNFEGIEKCCHHLLTLVNLIYGTQKGLCPTIYIDKLYALPFQSLSKILFFKSKMHGGGNVCTVNVLKCMGKKQPGEAYSISFSFA